MPISIFSLGDNCGPGMMLRKIGFQKKQESFALDWFSSSDLLKAVTFFTRYDPDFQESIVTKELDETGTRCDKYGFVMPHSITELSETSKKEIQLKYKFEFTRAKRIAKQSSGVYFFRREGGVFNEEKLDKIFDCKDQVEYLLKEFCGHDNFKVLIFPDFTTELCKRLSERHWVCLDKIDPDVESGDGVKFRALCEFISAQKTISENHLILANYCNHLDLSQIA